jgi:hypothetical protein
MKKVIKPYEMEEAVYYSDFNGTCFKEETPPVELFVQFHANSKFNLASLTFHLSDKEAEEFIKWIDSRITEEKRVSLKKACRDMRSNLDSLFS